jgi:hypothetical protein
LLQLLVLAGVEEDGVGIEVAQEAGDGAFVEGFVDIERVGGIFLENLIGVDELLHQTRVFIFDGVVGGERQDGAGEQKAEKCEQLCHS